MRNAWVQVDRGAIAHNVAALCARVAPAALCAVVKADGYGHGAPTVAGVALDAGAELLGVALVEEGGRLRQAGISAPILVLSEPPLDEMDVVVAHGLTPTVYTLAGLRAAELAAAEAGTVLGVLIFSTLTNIFILNNRSFSEQSLFKGAIIVAAVLLQQRLASRSNT